MSLSHGNFSHMVVGRASPVPASSFGFWLLRLRLRLTPPTCSFSTLPTAPLTEFGAEQFLVNLCLTVWNHYAGPQLPKSVVHVDLFQRQWKVHVLIAWRFRVLNDKNIFLIDQQLEIIFDSGVNRCRLDEIFVPGPARIAAYISKVGPCHGCCQIELCTGTSWSPCCTKPVDGSQASGTGR